MLHTIDNRLIQTFDAIAAYWQERLGFTMAVILREICMVMLIAFGFLFVTLAMSGDLVMIAVYLMFGAAGLNRLVADYRRHQADSQKDWTESLARKYLIQADLKRAAYGQQRFIVLSIITFFAVSYLLKAGAVFDNEMTAIFILFALYVVREYLTCAHPRPPGSKSRQAQGQLGFGTA
jgi:small-conductance mechanosensitive channel